MLHAILLFQLVAAPPQAQEAERLVHASIADFDLGAFDQALHEAEQAYRLYPLAQILFNIGQCHKALSHWDKAAFFYRRYLAKLPDAPNRQKVEALLAEVEYRFKAEQLAVPPPPKPEASVVGIPTPPPPPPPPVQPATAPPEATAPQTPAATTVVEGSQPHSHLLGIGLVIGGVIAGGIAGYGQFEVQTYLADRGVAREPNTGSYTHLFGEQQSAQSWLWPSVILGVLAAAGLTAGAITW